MNICRVDRWSRQLVPRTHGEAGPQVDLRAALPPWSPVPAQRAVSDGADCAHRPCLPTWLAFGKRRESRDRANLKKREPGLMPSTERAGPRRPRGPFPPAKVPTGREGPLHCFHPSRCHGKRSLISPHLPRGGLGYPFRRSGTEDGGRPSAGNGMSRGVKLLFLLFTREMRSGERDPSAVTLGDSARTKTR